jgi:hypothetical protein
VFFLFFPFLFFQFFQKKIPRKMSQENVVDDLVAMGMVKKSTGVLLDPSARGRW